MTSLKASLELWLKLQCQTQHKVTQAILISADSAEQYQLLAQSPASDTVPEAMIEAFKEVTRKQRIHLVKLDTQHMLLGQPIIVNDKYFGAVVMALANSNSQDTKAAVEILARGLVWLQFLLFEHTQNLSTNTINPVTGTADKPVSAGQQTVSEKQQSSIIEKLLQENSLQETAISLVNLLATQLQCSRVSLGWKTSSGVSLEAVSFSANFDKRTHAMQIVIDAMNEACDQGINIDCVANEQTQQEDSAAQIKRNHKKLLIDQSLQSVHSFLLRKDKRIVGVIMLEKSQPGGITDEQQEFITSQLLLITHILDLKKSATAGLWQKIKQITLHHINRIFGIQQSLLKVIGITIIAFIAVLFIPANYHISSDASLKSTYKHLLVSPQDGYLKNINARPGDRVKKGDVLAQLNDDELNLQRRKLASQLQQYQQEYDTALANSNRVAAAIANTQVEQADIQLRLVDQQLSRIQLLAPSDGIIVSDDISQSLGAPVKQGDVLFEIAAAQGYLVQLMVDERDIASLAVGQTGHVKLTSLPHDTFSFQVKTITPLSEVLNGRNYFRVEATLKGETNLLRPGMTGTGKIIAGKRSLGWIWFHDVWYWLSLKLWW